MPNRHFLPVYNGFFRVSAVKVVKQVKPNMSGTPECKIIGKYSELNGNKLPTHLDVIRCYYFEREKIEPRSFNRISNIVVKKLEDLWSEMGIPTVSSRRISVLLKSNIDQLEKLKKNYIRDKCKTFYKKKICSFYATKAKLFDIASCKCGESCTCKIKLPKSVRVFLYDQRSKRQMKKSAVPISDVEVPSETFLKDDITIDDAMDYGERSEQYNEDEENYINEDTENVWNPYWKKFTDQTRVNCPTFSKVCDRYGISYRSASLLASSLLHDISKFVPQVNGLVFDKSKIYRERTKLRDNLRKEQRKPTTSVNAVYFDGRRDETKTIDAAQNGSLLKRIKREEHTSLVQEPGSKYLGHVASSSSDAKTLANDIFTFFIDNAIDVRNINCLGCDGCPTNTGRLAGIVTLLESKFGNPVQWSICQLHGIELLLKALFIKLDGPTTGPNAFSGPIGKILESCEKLPVAKYDAVECSELISIDTSDLRYDQKYLLSMWESVRKGECSEDLASKSPGKLSHARWLTRANRILRTYIAFENPSYELRVLVIFVMRVYVPMWFNIKCHPYIKDGPKHLWKTIVLSSYLEDDLAACIRKVIQNNAYFGHPENILLAMLSDERREVRMSAVSQIVSLRDLPSTTQIRKFRVPTLNFNARDYTELINWNECQITEPPLLKSFITEKLLEFKEDDVANLISNEIFHLPCHTQAVERCVKEVTAVSKLAYSADVRDGIIRSRFESRKQIPRPETKNQLTF